MTDWAQIFTVLLFNAYVFDKYQTCTVPLSIKIMLTRKRLPANVTCNIFDSYPAYHLLSTQLYNKYIIRHTMSVLKSAYISASSSRLLVSAANVLSMFRTSLESSSDLIKGTKKTNNKFRLIQKLNPTWPVPQNSTGECGDQVHSTKAMWFPHNTSSTDRTNSWTQY